MSHGVMCDDIVQGGKGPCSVLRGKGYDIQGVEYVHWFLFRRSYTKLGWKIFIYLSYDDQGHALWELVRTWQNGRGMITSLADERNQLQRLHNSCSQLGAARNEDG